MLFCPLALPPSLHAPLQQMDNDTIVCWMIWESLTHHSNPNFRDAVQQQYRVEISDVFSLKPLLKFRTTGDWCNKSTIIH
jgi:hypothetical protein